MNFKLSSELSLEWKTSRKWLYGLMMCFSLNGVANSNPDEGTWSITVGIGEVNGSRSANSIKQDLSQPDLTINQVNVDDDRNGWNVNLGYQLTEHFTVELGYTDLGDVDVDVFATVIEPLDFIRSANVLHPNSADGVTFSGRYSTMLSDSFSAYARLGVFSWDGDFDSHFQGNNSNIVSSGISGTDLYYGVGGEYLLNKRISFALELSRYELDNDDSTMAALNLIYRF